MHRTLHPHRLDVTFAAATAPGLTASEMPNPVTGGGLPIATGNPRPA